MSKDGGNLHEVRTWLAVLAQAEALVPARVVLERLPVSDEPAVQGLEAEVDLTAESMGRLLGRSAGSIREWCRAGRLPGSYKLFGREWRVPRSALAALQRSEAEASARREHPKPPAPEEEVDIGAWRRLLPEDSRGGRGRRK